MLLPPPVLNSQDFRMGSSLFSCMQAQLFIKKTASHRMTEAQMFIDNERHASNLRLQTKLFATHPTCGVQKIEFLDRRSPNEVAKEMQRCYELISNLGRGVIYLGSSRVKKNHPHYLQTFELAKEVATLLDCTSWTGAGPGLMDAVIQGALEAQKPVGGLKIAKEAGEWTASNFHSYLPSETYCTCKYFSARKHGLVDAAVRNDSADRTAVVVLPGGIGTLDEAFEILALIQLRRIGSKLPVPFLLMNYDSFYTKLLEFLSDCEDSGTLDRGELASLCKVCDDNSEALKYLAMFYDLSHGNNSYMDGLKNR